MITMTTAEKIDLMNEQLGGFERQCTADVKFSFEKLNKKFEKVFNRKMTSEEILELRGLATSQINKKVGIGLYNKVAYRIFDTSEIFEISEKEVSLLFPELIYYISDAEYYVRTMEDIETEKLLCLQKIKDSSGLDNQ